MVSKSIKRGPSVPNPASQPPTPFSPAPAELEGLLSSLDRRSIYITHIDTFPAAHKRRIFCIPVVLNGAILALVLWRAYAALPTYLSLVWAALGQQTDSSVDTRKTSWTSLLWLVAKRCLLVLGDFAIFRIVGSWPYTFFLEAPENPCTWRWKLGFNDREVVVRKSRNWGAEELLGASKKGAESPFWKTRIAPAISKQWLREKTGYLMMGKDWDLDLAAMVAAQRAVEGKSLDARHLDGLVLGYWQKRWLAFNFMEEDGQSSTRKDQFGMTEEQGMKQMSTVRVHLASMGKEALFFRMIELVQYEGSTPSEFGGFSADRQQATLGKIKKLFSDNDVDFEQMLGELGIESPVL